MKFTSIFFTASAVYLRDLSQMYKFYNTNRLCIQRVHYSTKHKNPARLYWQLALSNPLFIKKLFEFY